MRLFLGVFPTVDLTERLQSFRDKVEACLPRACGPDKRVRWVKPDRWHLSLQFLGAQEGSLVDRLRPRLAEALSGFKSFPVEFGALGCFPKAARARVLWLGLGAGSDAFLELAERTQRGLDALGVSFDRKPIHPHLTLARFAGRSIALEKLPVAKLAPLLIRKITLVESKLEGPQKGYVLRYELPLAPRS